MHHPTDRIAHTTAFVTPVVEHWLEREIAQWVKNWVSTKSYLHKKCFKITKRIMHNTPINVKHKHEFTILESIRALAKNLPMNLNLDLILLRAAALVLRARGAGKRPHADCMYLIFTSGSEHKERKCFI